MLERLKVTVRTGAMVVDIKAHSVTIKCGEQTEVIPTRTILWAAGVLASPLGLALAKRLGAKTDRAGRVIVDPDMTIPGHPDIFVIGDLSSFSHQTGKPLPGVAQPAIQQGRYIAEVIERRLRGEKISPFRYFDKGNLATIGRGAAVADLNFVTLAGLPAWLIWIFIHLMYIVEFQNRLLVFLQWMWLYITFDRTARLITGKNPLPLDL
jgi:NADH dehydrogenase